LDGIAAGQTLIGVNFESFTDQRACNLAAVCRVSFPPIPAGKTILVQRVVCKTASNAVPYYVFFGPSAVAEGPLLKQTYFLLEPPDKLVNSYYYNTIESLPDIMINAGRFPTVLFQMDNYDANIYLECSMSGIAL
jgi:hypothetical protein